MWIFLLVAAAGLAILLVIAAPVQVTALTPVGDVMASADLATGLWHVDKDPGPFYFGNSGDYPILGDWDGDGVRIPGMYRQPDGYVYLKNSNTQGNADLRFFFGDPGDVPISGDSTGMGTTWRRSIVRRTRFLHHQRTRSERWRPRLRRGLVRVREPG